VVCVGEWLSLVEHLVRDQGVGGSNPLSPTIYFLTYKFNANTLGDLSCSYDSLGRRTQVSGSFAQTGLPDGWRNESVVQNSGWPALS
jgi:hypothetical protein